MLATAQNTHFSEQQLFDEIDILPVDLKTKLVDKILASLTPISKSIDEAWTKEAMRRKADIEAGEVSLVNGEEVFGKIAQKFNR